MDNKNKERNDTINILNFFGNSSPTVSQINLMKLLIKNSCKETSYILFDKLTNQEKSCLLYAAKGYSVQDTSDKLKIKSSTVISHRKSILKKLKAATMAEAVYRGIKIDILPQEN